MGYVACLPKTDTQMLQVFASYLVFVQAAPFNQFTQLSNFAHCSAGAERIFCSCEMAPRLTRARLTCALVAMSLRGILGLGQTVRRETLLPETFALMTCNLRYDDDQTVLGKPRCLAKPGQKIAFVGSTGCKQLLPTLLTVYDCPWWNHHLRRHSY